MEVGAWYNVQSLPRVLMSRQELRTSDPKTKLQCLIMEGSSSRIEPFADLLSLSLSPQCIHQTVNSPLPRAHRSTSHQHLCSLFPEARASPTHTRSCKQTSHSSLKATLAPHPHPQGPFPPPSFFLPLPHPCSAGLVYIAASPPWGLHTLPNPGRDQNLILEK